MSANGMESLAETPLLLFKLLRLRLRRNCSIVPMLMSRTATNRPP